MCGTTRDCPNETRTYPVCGFPALYTLLKTTTATSARLAHYAQAPEEQTQSVVSFGAMVFER